MQRRWAIFLPKVKTSLIKCITCSFPANLLVVGDYSIFVKDWTQPNGGIRGYVHRFLASGDPTFQHIAIWTLLQLLESEDKELVDLISKANDIIQMIKTISDKNIESDEEEGEDGEGEVVALARRSLELLKEKPEPPRQTLTEG